MGADFQSLVDAPPPRAAATQPRGCLPTLAVLLLMVGIVGTGFVASEAVADLPSPPVEVGQGVTFQPLPGWEFGGRSDDGSGLLLSRGSGTMAIQLVDRSLTPEVAAQGLLDEWLGDPDIHMTHGPLGPVRLPRGLAGSRFHYAGTFPGIVAPVQGEVTGVPGTQVTIVVDAWAGDGEYDFIRSEVDRMIVEATL